MHSATPGTKVPGESNRAEFKLYHYPDEDKLILFSYTLHFQGGSSCHVPMILGQPLEPTLMKIIRAFASIPTLLSKPMVFTTLPVVLLAGVFLQGCSSMGTVNREKSAALGRLSPADRQVAMTGEIRQGFSKEAVYAAWGAPSKKSAVPTAQGIRECWTYTRSFNSYGGGYYGISRGLVHGKNGDHYDSDDFYPAPDTNQTLGGTPSTEVPVKRAVFEHGRVTIVETTHADNQSDDSSDWE